MLPDRGTYFINSWGLQLVNLTHRSATEIRQLGLLSVFRNPSGPQEEIWKQPEGLDDKLAGPRVSPLPGSMGAVKRTQRFRESDLR